MPFERSEETRETYKRVEDWANWSRRGGSGIQGWSTTSASYRLAEQHRTGVRYEPGFISNHIDPEIEAVEQVIMKLPERLKSILYCEFFTRGPIEVRARAGHVSVSTFKRVLSSALLVVGARLANAVDVSHERQ